jgi:hypothetical protein
MHAQNIAWFAATVLLDSPDFYWLWWDWQNFAYEPFPMPAIGKSVTLAGPSR